MSNYTTSNTVSKGVIKTVVKEFKSLGLFERKQRKLRDLTALTKTFSAFISSQMSLESLTFVYEKYSKDHVKVSSTTFKKLFQKHDKYRQVFENLLSSVDNSAKPRKILGNKNCILLDTTFLNEEGKKGETYRVHTAFGMTKNQVAQAVVTDKRTAESACNFDIVKGAIYFGDRAYGLTKQMEYVVENGADFVFRFKTSGAILYTDKECTQRFKVAPFLTNSSQNTISKVLYLKSGQKIRFIARRLNARSTQNALKKSTRRANSKGQQIKDDTVKMCEWMMVVTSLVGKHSSEQILSAYRWRWQIELHFKRFKTLLGLRKIRKSTKNYAYSTIYLALIMWFCLEQYVERGAILKKVLSGNSKRNGEVVKHAKKEGTTDLGKSLWSTFSLALFEFTSSLFS